MTQVGHPSSTAHYMPTSRLPAPTTKIRSLWRDRKVHFTHEGSVVARVTVPCVGLPLSSLLTPVGQPSSSATNMSTNGLPTPTTKTSAGFSSRQRFLHRRRNQVVACVTHHVREPRRRGLFQSMSMYLFSGRVVRVCVFLTDCVRLVCAQVSVRVRLSLLVRVCQCVMSNCMPLLSIRITFILSVSHTGTTLTSSCACNGYLMTSAHAYL